MGNCQAAEAATAVIQHPGGRVERLYWPATAAEVMQSNPGHYVALVTLFLREEQREGGGGSVRLTRVRLLKPKETLLFGQVYRLISSQEVTKAIQARKNEKMKKMQSELIKKQKEEQQRQSRTDLQNKEVFDGGRQIYSESTDQVSKLEKERQKNGAQLAGRARQWRPSLQSISEAGS